MAIQTQAKIPVVDFSNEDLKPGSSSWSSMRRDVCRALEEYGCFVAELGNKVPLEIHDTIFGAVRELFDFPTETKKKLSSERPGHGYFSKAFYERLAIGNGNSPEETQKLTNIFWPNGNVHFRESADSYAKLMEELDQMVMRMVFENYGVEKYYDSLTESVTRTLGFIKYKDAQNITSACNALDRHTDKTFTTILHQNQVKGLEIKTKDGQWVGFDYSPSSFILLAADALQVWSNDRIPSCIHRVQISENETRTRYSFGLFTFYDKITSVPEELVDEEHPLRYKPLNIFEYLKANVGHGGELSIKAYCGI
ncbi:hypothetical protein RGQ29_002990 [Quercus rubra]|uniref:Fe2OG dioxygenase domain-containing protein n=1 Tax=Quercus rubra TaxID=3512 RepID=A0AAN7I6X7_QUERU|nr:hypothetical protein RGQ29_002990 [Quercus rubra]